MAKDRKVSAKGEVEQREWLDDCETRVGDLGEGWSPELEGEGGPEEVYSSVRET